MRVPLVALLAGCLAIPPVSPAFASAGPATEEEKKRAKELYEQGRQAYQLGKYDEAVAKWEESFSLSEQPLLLYNIALAYKGRYTVSDDIADLRKALAIISNFNKLASADPSLGLEDGQQIAEELKTMIEEAEEAKRNDQPPPRVEIEPAPPRLIRDPGLKLRAGGIVAMAVGSTAVLTGIGLGSYFAIAGKGFAEEIDDLEATDPDPCAGMPAPPPGTLDTRTVACRQLEADLATARDNRRAAKIGAGASFGLGIGLGVAGIAAGVVLYLRGKKVTRDWENGVVSDLRIAPTLGGAVISGRL